MRRVSSSVPMPFSVTMTGQPLTARGLADRGFERFGIELVAHLRALGAFGRQQIPFLPKRTRV